MTAWLASLAEWVGALRSLRMAGARSATLSFLERGGMVRGWGRGDSSLLLWARGHKR